MIHEPFGEEAIKGFAEEAGPGEAGLGQPSPPDELGGETQAPENGGTPPTGEAREGLPGNKQPPARPSARSLTITVVFVTLMAALGGFLLNRASVASSDNADVAQVLSLRSAAAQTSGYQVAQTAYENYRSAQALQAQGADELQEAANNSSDGLMWARLYQATQAQEAQAAGAVPADLHANLPDGQPDSEFPYDFYAEQSAQGTFLSAQSDAYNDVSARWSKLVDSYTAILTMLAVALFLFGSAFVLYGRNRMLFSVIASLLSIISIVWGGALFSVSEPGKPSVTAAQDYARGAVAMASAITPAGFQPAINDFTAAIGARPDFALAYAERAVAETERGSDQLGGGFITDVAPRWLKVAAADYVKAYDLGDHDADQVLDVGFSYYQLWVQAGGHGTPPSQAVTFFRQAAQLDPGNPPELLDYALSELASRNYATAREAFRVAVTHILFTCTDPSVLSSCTSPQPRTSIGLQEAWFAGAMETLVTLASSADASSEPELRAQVASTKGALAESMALGHVVTVPDDGDVKIGATSTLIDPNLLWLDIGIPAGESPDVLATTPVTMLWYDQAPGSTKWDAIPELTCWGQLDQCAFYSSEANVFESQARFLPADNSCLTNVRYRGELYVRGSLARTLTPTYDDINTSLQAGLNKQMDMGICVPSSWHLSKPLNLSFHINGTSQTVTGSLAGSEMSYQSAGGREGTYVFRLYDPAASSVPSSQLGPLAQKMGSYVIGLLKSRGLPADTVLTTPFAAHNVWGGNVQYGQTGVFDSSSTGTEAFVGVGLIAARTTSTSAQADRDIANNIRLDHAFVVTIVFGHRGTSLWRGADPLALQVFTSWSLLGYG
ncbi:MAG: hypothetical protein ABSA91_03115 [Acidimicrobiales bacterium]